jgi:hypothetical protein
MTPTYLAMMWRYPDGTFTFGFYYLGSIALLMFASGIWGLVAPESLRVFYVNIQRKLHSLPGNRNRSEAPRPGWGWGSTTAIRLVSAIAIGLAAAFMTWVLFFTIPGRAY